MAKEFLSQHNLSYSEHDISKDEKKVEALTSLTGKMIVPTLVINDEVFIGFAANREEIEKLLL